MNLRTVKTKKSHLKIRREKEGQLLLTDRGL